jgi:uncharacterized protein (DUF427 family)
MLQVSGARIANGAWTYHETTPRAEAVRGFVAFYDDKLEIRVG